MFKKLILFCGLAFFAFAALSQDLPAKPSTLVTDYTNTLSDGDKQTLEKKLDAFDDSTSTQIAILMIKSVGEYDISEYAQKVGRAWGIGQKGKNNGLLILVALGDRKVSIQTGYGVEDRVPDVITNEIIQNDIKPRFKAGDYYGGLNAATDDLIKYTKGEYKSDKPSGRQGRSGGGSIFFLIIIVVVVLIIVFRGRGGGGGQIIDSRGGASPFWWFLGGALLGRGSGGGDWGGFSGGGGGSDSGGGGFGGFGGGDFGGGGSSGSW